MVEKKQDDKVTDEKKVELVSSTEKAEADASEESKLEYASSARERHNKADPTKSNIPINPDKEDV